jgi:hypothetical protein
LEASFLDAVYVAAQIPFQYIPTDIPNRGSPLALTACELTEQVVFNVLYVQQMTGYMMSYRYLIILPAARGAQVSAINDNKTVHPENVH